MLSMWYNINESIFMNKQGFLTKDELLNKKRDYSPFLVHLTREQFDDSGIEVVSAREVLEYILQDKKLIASKYFCLFKENIDTLSDEGKNRFKVVCFTETPIDQIEILLEEVQGRSVKFRPYGLIFTKEYIREKEGNPVFYAEECMYESLWRLYYDAKDRAFSYKDNKFLALVNKCDKKIDFHWEREWRIVGDFNFQFVKVFCGLCPEQEISNFEQSFNPIKFISPSWGINKILYKLVGK
jgi:hypothetical protein